MNKNIFIIYLLLVIFGLTNKVNAHETYIDDEIHYRFSDSNIRPTLYSVTFNRHGKILKTSVGTFYLGNSNDAIYEFSGRKNYGYWEGNNDWVAIYINGTVYQFE